jgi:hypothetical protein
MKLARKDFPLTKNHVQFYINEKADSDILAQAGNGEACLLAEAYRFLNPDSHIFVNYDLVNIDGEDFYLKPWQQGMMRRLDKRFGISKFNKRIFEYAGGMKRFAKYDPEPTSDEW